MRINRARNAVRNIVFGTLLRAYQILIPFLMRTAMIYFMGVQYLGLNSLFASVLQVLNLAELGVGSAMVYSMYKPITDDDTESICALMRLYRTYYRVIGAIIAIIGTVLTPFIPHLIKSDLPADVDIYVLYILNLAATVLSYWLFAYKNALFHAHQRVDITSKITLITTSIQYVIQLAAIIFTGNYYLYVIVALLTQALTNIVTAVIAEKMYPSYGPHGKMDKNTVREINHRIRDLFTAKLGAVVVNSADTVVISAFLGLTVLAIFQNYYFILTAVIGFVAVIFQACTAGIGNSVIVETKEKNFNDLNKFTFLIAWIAGVCTCCFLCLYQPFMELWVGKDLMLSFSAVVCFCMYYFIYEINQLLNTYKDAAGIWHEDRFRPLVTALTNIVMNLITVHFWGIYGVLLSTVLSMLFVGMPWLLHNLFTVLFDKSQMNGYLKKLGKYVVTAAVSCFACWGICRFIKCPLWLMIALRAGVCVIVSNAIYLFIYRKMPEFAQCADLVKNMRRRKAHTPIMAELPHKNVDSVKSAYAAYSPNKAERLGSSSGGVFSILAKDILSKNGVVYGVTMSDDLKGAKFIRVTDKKELYRLRGAKYLQACAGKTFNSVKTDLDNGLYVLFSGTGCQVNGLRSFLSVGGDADEKYPNLCCVDVVCHGVPSQALWRRYVEYIERENNARLVNIRFRCSRKDWRISVMNRMNIKKKKVYISNKDDPYMLMFLRDYCLRPSCYKCQAKEEKYSDLTIADFWGIGHVAPEMDDGMGTSLILTRTRKGEELLNHISSKLSLKRVKYAEGVQLNKAEYESAARPSERDTFFDDMRSMTFAELKSKYGMPTVVPVQVKLKNKIKSTIRRTLMWGAEENYAYYLRFDFEGRKRSGGNGHD